MITYTERACFTLGHIRLLRHVEECLSRVSDGWGNELRCHELARAVQTVVTASRAMLMAFVVADGKCGPIEHSWLCFSDGVILDPYVPGRLPAVQIIDPIVGAAYRPGTARSDIKQSIIDRLVLEMRGDVTSTLAPPVRPSARD